GSFCLQALIGAYFQHLLPRAYAQSGIPPADPVSFVPELTPVRNPTVSPCRPNDDLTRVHHPGDARAIDDSFGSYPGSLMGTIAYIRQVYLDGGQYKTAKITGMGDRSPCAD